METVMHAPQHRRSVGLSVWNAQAINAKLLEAQIMGRSHLTVAFASPRGVWPLRILVGTQVLYASGVTITLRTPEGALVHYTVKR